MSGGPGEFPREREDGPDPARSDHSGEAAPGFDVAGQAAPRPDVAGQAAPGFDVAGQAAPGFDVAGQAAPAPDPWKSFRGVMAGTLVLEAIVVLLALPVVAVLGGGLTAAAGTYLIGLAAVLVGLSAVQGRSWAIWVNLAMQLVVIGGLVFYPAIGVVGVIFGAVWLLIAYLRAEVLRRQKRGLLPGQQPPPE
jgi:hypothetical protein